MKDVKENVFRPLVNNLAQSIKEKYRARGLNQVLKDIEGAEILTELAYGARFHMRQLEVGYYYIINSSAEWINVILPLRKKNNQISYLRATIMKTPMQGRRFWVHSVSTYKEKITKDSYWSHIQLALKIPIFIPMFKFINWPNTNPLEVKE